MINSREAEIRNESLALVLEAYRVANLLPRSVDAELRNRLVNESFNVSSSIAEAFKTVQNDQSESAIIDALKRVVELHHLIDRIAQQFDDNASLLGGLFYKIDELRAELSELRAALQLINTELISPKLELACI